MIPLWPTLGCRLAFDYMLWLSGSESAGMRKLLGVLSTKSTIPEPSSQINKQKNSYSSWPSLSLLLLCEIPRQRARTASRKNLISYLEEIFALFPIWIRVAAAAARPSEQAKGLFGAVHLLRRINDSLIAVEFLPGWCGQRDHRHGRSTHQNHHENDLNQRAAHDRILRFRIEN